MSHQAIPSGTTLPELTIRGVILGAIITVVFTASNVYLGLKVGLTFSSSIPAAVISMAVLRMFSRTNILENNIVQTQASAAGTLSAIIFILPGLLMMGHWQGFPFLQTAIVCGAGGMLGVIFSIPLRHVMVVKSDLPYPEGVAAAEILRAGSQEDDEYALKKKDSGMADILSGGCIAAVVSVVTSGFRVLADSADYWVIKTQVAFRLPAGFSLALVGAGYLIGTISGIAILVGLIFSWGIAVPYLTWKAGIPADGDIIGASKIIWASDVRLIGAGTMAIAAIWTLITLFKPMIEGMKMSFRAFSSEGKGTDIPRTERDISPFAIIVIFMIMLVVLIFTFRDFIVAAAIPQAMGWGLVCAAVLFAVVLGFMVAAACGYMAGLVGSSASPISGIGIIGITAASLLLLLVGETNGMLATPEGSQFATALALFTTTAIVAIGAISNDNLQDLKTGYLVGATPWKQQIALLIGCVVGALVIAPVLEVLYQAYGFSGAMPRAGMDAEQALNAPQAVLMTKIAQGIFSHNLNWSMILTGVGLGMVLIVMDCFLRRRYKNARLPVLAVGMGIYLPPSVEIPLIAGAMIAWFIEGKVYAHSAMQQIDPADLVRATERRGVLLASGLIVGEALVGVILAVIIAASVYGGGSDAPLAYWFSQYVCEVTPQQANIGGLIVFVSVCSWFTYRVLTARSK